MSTEKAEKQINPKQRGPNGVKSSFRANIGFHPLGILNIYLMQTNYAFKTETHKEEKC